MVINTRGNFHGTRSLYTFSRNILFQYKCIHRTEVLEGIRKNANIYTIPQQLKFPMLMMIPFYMI